MRRLSTAGYYVYTVDVKTLDKLNAAEKEELKALSAPVWPNYLN